MCASAWSWWKRVRISNPPWLGDQDPGGSYERSRGQRASATLCLSAKQPTYGERLLLLPYSTAASWLASEREKGGWAYARIRRDNGGRPYMQTTLLQFSKACIPTRAAVKMCIHIGRRSLRPPSQPTVSVDVIGPSFTKAVSGLRARPHARPGRETRAAAAAATGDPVRGPQSF